MSTNKVYTNGIQGRKVSDNRNFFSIPFANPTRSSLRELLQSDETLILPGATDALTARLVERAGFKACYVSGAGFANVQLGLPDVGMVSHFEMAQHIRRMADATDLPIVADGDTGHGGVLSVARTVRLFETAGASAIQLEDQEMPKRCGHFEGRRQLVSSEEMVAKIRAARAAAVSPDFLIVARTDACAVHGIEDAIARALAFRDAGADVVFVEALRSHEELVLVPQKVRGIPLIVNIVEGGKTPELSVSELSAMGYRIVLYANFVMRVMAKAAQDALEHLRENGETRSMGDRMLSWNMRQEIVALSDWQDLELKLEGQKNGAAG